MDAVPSLFEMVPDALIVVDQNGRIEMANRQAERLFGYPERGLDGLEIERLMPEDVRHRHRTHRAGYMAAPRTRAMGAGGMALIGQRRDGRQFPVEIALSPLPAEGRPRFLASVRDISATQRAQQTLVRARYDALIARLGQEALASPDADLLISTLPGLLAETLSVETVLIAFIPDHGKGDFDIRASVGLDRALLDTRPDPRLQQALAAGQPMLVEDLTRDPLPFPLVDGAIGSGAIVPLLDRKRPTGLLLARAQRPGAFDHDAVHLLQSVGNLLAAQIQRQRTEEQLAHAQRLEAIGQLTGGIAHDFNNLLTVMSGNLQLLQIECEGRSAATEMITSARRSASRGAELTSKLLAFARRQRLDPAAVAPAPLLEDLEGMLRRTLGEAIQLEVACAADAPAVFADLAQLDAALLNLALNARDAMPGGGKLTIAASARSVESLPRNGHPPPGHYVVFSVTDTGMGMTSETLAHAVEPFFTTKGAGRGSGLGLSMVYGFAAQSSGHLHISSRLGQGCCVELYLPVAAADAAAAPDPADAAAPEGAGETVLVVEDEASVRAIAVAFVQSLGYRAVAASNADDALALVDSEPAIALLFTDLLLGAGMDGRALARAARERRPDLPVLLTSGYEDAPHREGGRFELLRKPYLREELAAALHRAIGSRRA